jgi:hypothetical protein
MEVCNEAPRIGCKHSLVKLRKPARGTESTSVSLGGHRDRSARSKCLSHGMLWTDFLVYGRVSCSIVVAGGMSA